MNKVTLLPIAGMVLGALSLVLRLIADSAHPVDSVVFIAPSALLTVSVIGWIRIRRRTRIWNI